MTIPSWQFLAFVLGGAAIFNAVATTWWRETVWLVLNLAFISSFCHAPAALLPLAGFLALGFLCIRIARGRRRWSLPAAAGLVLVTFIWLKRYSFIPVPMLLPPGVMTLGLSYVFFRVMHLVIDAGQGADQPIEVVRFLNFTLNFPAFLSGPIQRLEDYEAQGSLSLRLPDAGLAAWRMIVGAFKVLILSTVLQRWQFDTISNVVPDLPLGYRMLGGATILALYPLFLYANFSGYTDFVIGAARLFRLRLPENFDRPFLAPNFIDFGHGGTSLCHNGSAATFTTPC